MDTAYQSGTRWRTRSGMIATIIGFEPTRAGFDNLRLVVQIRGVLGSHRLTSDGRYLLRHGRRHFFDLIEPAE